MAIGVLYVTAKLTKAILIAFTKILLFDVVLFIRMCKVVLTLESMGEVIKCDHSTKATEQKIPVAMFTMLYKVVLAFELWMKS